MRTAIEMIGQKDIPALQHRNVKGLMIAVAMAAPIPPHITADNS